MTFARKIFFALICALFFCLGADYTPAQETNPSIKIESTLVSVPVIVSDRSGRYIAGLKQQDFNLYKDGAKQQVAFFTAEEEPLNVALLLDTSLSTRNVLSDIKDRAKGFIKQLRPQDRAMIVTFDYDVHTLCSLTSDRKVLEQAIKHAEVGEYAGTTLRDAVFTVFTNSFKQIKGRKAIVLLTDGKDHGSRVSTEDLLDAATESDTMIYSIFFLTKMPNRFQPMYGRRFPMGGPFPRRFPDREQRRERREKQDQLAADFLEELSEVSAGRFYRSEVGDLKKQFGLIADELRHQYRLGFYPDSERKEGTTHRLRVEVSQQDAVVRARRSYVD